ncbi:heavy-metal-associated domain-containing protein [Bacillus massiliglaciei]|uniref:heavy-metal-associated domain-containing protein n=1 Tax=Bacillus massiliglaciei TaxID=1816693 RepID=UPI000DA613AC|nr:heavy-metal-associated domain-containing protein [Bacillus massiliglaciei]
MIKIANMTNGQDAEKVHQTLQSVWGVRQVDVSVHKQEASVSFNENAASFEDFLQALKETGYSPDSQ